MLAAVFTGSLSVHAAEDQNGKAQLVPTADGTGYELIRSRTFDGGLAADASAPDISTISLNDFPGSYGAQLDGLSRTVYNALVNYYVTKSGTGEVAVTVNLSFSWKGSRQDMDNSETYERAMSNMDYAVASAYVALIYDYPELYWAHAITSRLKSGDTRITSGSKKNSWNGTIYAVRLSLGEIYSGAKYQKASFDQAVRSAAGVATGTPYEKVKKIHDYICAQAVYPYDTDKDVYHSAAGLFLKGGYVVCEGYAKAFMILCRQAGIKAILIAGDAGGPHMWNYVQLDGKWYALDATWDDQVGRNPSYAYFLIGSNTLVSKGQFASTRILSTVFTQSDSKRFGYPILNGTAYTPYTSNTHTHNWVTLPGSKPTCTQTGKTVYRCQLCGEESYDIEEAFGHSFSKRRYVYNNDATVFHDGTKNLLCDNCGAVCKKVTAKGTRLEPTIKLNAKKLVLRKGQSTKALKVKGLARGDAVKSWKSSNTKVFKVSRSGRITAKRWAGNKAKTAKLTITLKSGLKKTIKVRVQPGKVTTTKLAGVKKTLKMKKGARKSIRASVKPITSQQKVSYRSSNKKVVSVSSSGMLTAKKKGKATITIRSGSKKIKCKVTVR